MTRKLAATGLVAVAWLGGLRLLARQSPLPASAPAAQRDAPAAPPEALPPPEEASVVVWRRPIVTLRGTYDARSPSERAAAASARIESVLGKNPGAALRTQAVEAGGRRGVLIFADTELLVVLLEEDLDPGSRQTLESLTDSTVARLREVAQAMALQRQPAALARAVGESFAVLAALALLLWGLARARRSLLERFRRAASRRPPTDAAERRGRLAETGLDFRSVGFGAASVTLRGLTIVVALLAVFLCAGIVLRRFPYTSPLGEALATRVLFLAGRGLAAIVDALPGLFVVVVVFVVARAVARLVSRSMQAIEQGTILVPRLDPEAARATRRLVVIGIWLGAVALAYPFVPGSDSESFKGLSVLVGLMVSLGSAGVVGQMISGLVVVYSRAVRPGDYVRVGEHEGTVTELGMLSAKLVTRHGEEVNIPNSVLVGSPLRNSTRLAAPGGAALQTAVTISYDAPWRQVHALLRLAAERTPGVLREPEPRVFQRALSDFFVEYELSVQVERQRSRAEVATRLHAEIQDAFNEHGVQIMAPHFQVQPERPVVVPKGRWSPPPASGDAERG